MSKSKVQILWGKDLVDDPRSLAGSTAVVLDVLAATTNISNFLVAQPKRLYLANAGNIMAAIKKFPDALIIGESRDPALQNIFKFSNNPSRLEEGQAFKKAKGKEVIYMTNNGTNVVRSAIENKAQTTITAGFNNLEVVAQYLAKLAPTSIVIIPSGERSFARWKTTEDRIAGETLNAILKGESVNWREIKRQVAKRALIKYRDNYLDAGLTVERLKYDIEIVFRRNVSIVPDCELQADELGLIVVSDNKFT